MSEKEKLEQFVLRFHDPALAERVRRALREEDQIQDMQISFPDAVRHGTLTIDGETHRVDLLDLPTVVESYKTYDDTNLVKTGDIGQVLLVGGPVKSGQVECEDGVTPPMHKARQRHFKQLPRVNPQVVQKVEADLLSILQGGAPAGYEYYDVEEEWVVDPRTGQGSWQKIQPPPPPPAPPAGAAPAAAAGGAAGTAAAGAKPGAGGSAAAGTTGTAPAAAGTQRGAGARGGAAGARAAGPARAGTRQAAAAAGAAGGADNATPATTANRRQPAAAAMPASRVSGRKAAAAAAAAAAAGPPPPS